MMPDSCRLHTDNDHEIDVTADPEEACVEACPTTQTDDAQQESNAGATVTPQHHGKHTTASKQQLPKMSPCRNRPKQTSHSCYARKCRKGYPNTGITHRV